jgi:hypothetical protein
MVQWTKLYGTRIWKECEYYYNSSNRKYHNLQHIRDMYKYAEELGFRYDEDLDHAILAHDLIFDSLPHKEVRSIQEYAYLYSDIYGTALNSAVYDHVLKTVDHKFARDSRMVILDMWGVTKPHIRERNFDDILYENECLYGENNAEASIAYMKNMYNNMRNTSMYLDGKYSVPIMEGIVSTIGLWAMHK